ncbi:MAG: ABC transporter substrate-binding protein [Gemmatimonadaceae bacterium]
MSLSRLPLLALLILVACRGGDAGHRRTLVDARDRYDPKSLDPALSTDVPTGRAVSYLFDGLTRFSPDAKVGPALATRWEVTPDGRTYLFHLRAGVRFHDGSLLHASDVVHSFTRVLDPANKSGRPWPLYPIAGARAFAAGKAATVTGVTAVDDSTVRIALDTALAIFPKLLAMPVASVVPTKISPDFGEHPIGTGAWTLVAWQHDDYVLLARNSEYFGGAPKLDSLLIRIIPEPSTAVAEFESGNVDLLYVPEADAQRWEQTDEKKALLTSAPALRLWYVALNTTRGPLKDARVRQALNHAVDVRTILDRLLGGRGHLAAGVIPPSLEGADDARAPYAYDTTAARKLLVAAGYAKGFGIELWVPQDPAFARVAESIQSYLAVVGVRVKLVQRESAAAREASRNGQADMFIKDWYADYPDAENFLYPLLHGANRGVGGNVSFYENAEFDRIVSQSRTEQDSVKRAALYRQADSLAFVDAPMIYLFFYNELYAVQPWVKGFVVPTIFNGQKFTDVTITAH